MIFDNSEVIKKVTEYNETLGGMLKWYLDDPEPSEEDVKTGRCNYPAWP